MNRKEDLRVRKTKAALNNAFAELLVQTEFENISVNELCAKASIRRATFYKHYKDKYDFLSEYIGFLRITYDTKPGTRSNLESTADYYINYAKRIVEYIDANEKLVNNVLSSSQLHIIVGLITEKNYQDTCTKLQANVDAGMILPASVEVVSSMLTGGVATAILHWLLDGRSRDVKLLTQEIAALVEKILRA